MALSEEQKASLTLAELEEMAARFRAAVDTIVEARALLGVPPDRHASAPIGEPPSRLPPNLPTTTPVWTPEEQALRQKLRAQARADAEAEAARRDAEFQAVKS